jgi:hypothetical protein
LGPTVAFGVGQDSSLRDVHFSGYFAQPSPSCVARLNLLPGFVSDLSEHTFGQLYHGPRFLYKVSLRFWMY